MAATWICEVCGRANAGDLCPGCATPRPINVRYWRIGHDQGYKGVYDGISPARFTPLVLIPVSILAMSIFHVGVGVFGSKLDFLAWIAGAIALILSWKYLVAGWWLLVRRIRRR